MDYAEGGVADVIAIVARGGDRCEWVGGGQRCGGEAVLLGQESLSKERRD